MNRFGQILVAGAFFLANDRSQYAGLKGYVCAE
jgi:hypothetical protein